MEVEIIRLGHQGDGIAEGPLYAPMTLPGERVTGQVDGSVLRDVRIVTPSEHRVTPPCRHFKSCGGCQLMHGADAFVADWKQEVVRRALAAQGLVPPLRPLATSPPQSRRRASFAARRTKSGAMAGFHGRASDTLIETPDCQLITPALLKGRELAAEIARVGASRKAVMSVLVTETLGGLDVAVSGGKPMTPALFSTLSELAEVYGLARLTWDEDRVGLRVAPEVAMGRARVVPPPGAFLQATVHGQEILTAGVRDAVAGASRIVDLFAGCGTFALPLAESCPVHAVEGDAAMLAALDYGWRHASGLRRVTTEPRDLFRNPLLPDELGAYDAAVIDPPRAGAQAQCAELAKAQIPVIAFVSCNPTTFARDAKILTEAGYRLEWVQVVDQFRWSTHVELVASLRLKHM